MDLIKIINKIKLSRMKPEEKFIIDIFNRAEKYFVKDKFIKFRIGNETVLSYDKRYYTLWVDFFIMKNIFSYGIEYELLIIKFFNIYLHDGEVKFINYGAPRKNIKYIK